METRNIGPEPGPDGFEYELSEDKKTVRVGVVAGMAPVWSNDLSKDELTKLIWYLGRARSEIEKAEGTPLPPEQQEARVIMDPRWFSAWIPEKNGSLLVFNHPAFGTLGFITPLKWAATLARLLITQIESVLPAPSTEKQPSDNGDVSQ